MHEDYSIHLFLKNCVYITAGLIGATGITHEAIFILALFMVLDVITGIAKNGIIDGWRSITSSKLSSGVIAKLLIMLIPLVIALAGIGSGIDLKFVATSSLSILIMSEAYSILGNIHSASTGKKSPEFDAVGYILQRFRETIETMLQATKKK